MSMRVLQSDLILIDGVTLRECHLHGIGFFSLFAFGIDQGS